MLALQPHHNGRDILQAQYNRQESLNARTPDVLQPRQIETQDLVVEEQQGGKSLLVRGRGDLTRVGKPGKKRLDLRRPKLARVAQFVKSDEQANPVDVDVFGPRAVMQIS